MLTVPIEMSELVEYFLYSHFVPEYLRAEAPGASLGGQQILSGSAPNNEPPERAGGWVGRGGGRTDEHTQRESY